MPDDDKPGDYAPEPDPTDYRPPHYAPEPNFTSLTTMNLPHGYEGWPLDNPADFADLVTEAADSLHFLFTFFPSYANQRSCLANTLALLHNIATGIRVTTRPAASEDADGILAQHTRDYFRRIAYIADNGDNSEVYTQADKLADDVVRVIHRHAAQILGDSEPS